MRLFLVYFLCTLEHNRRARSARY